MEGFPTKKLHLTKRCEDITIILSRCYNLPLGCFHQTCEDAPPREKTVTRKRSLGCIAPAHNPQHTPSLNWRRNSCRPGRDSVSVIAGIILTETGKISKNSPNCHCKVNLWMASYLPDLPSLPVLTGGTLFERGAP